MSSIRKEGKNYIISFYWHDTKYRRSLKVPTRKLAENLQREYDQILAKGKFPDDVFKGKSNEIESLNDLSEEFIKYLEMREKQYSPKTIKGYKFNLKILNEIIGNIEIKRISKSMVEKDIVPYLYEHYKKSTVRHFITHFRAIFNKAIDWSVIDRNPFAKMVPRADKKKPRYFSKEEVQTLEEYFSKKDIPRWQYDIVFLGLNTGLRKHELFNLTWKNVDLKNQQLIITGKGNKERIVPLNEHSIKILNNRGIHIKKVFHEANNIDSIGTMWQRMRQRTGLDIRFHDIRSTYSSYYIMNGGSVMRLKEILGHEDIQTTMIYATLSPENLHKDKEIVGF